MIRLIIILLFLQSYFFSIAQNNIKKYVQEHVSQVFTIDPDSINFSDLEVFGDAIGDSKIVMLGEQDHGDAPTFLAKTRMIKYLHEKKGFNVLAFESDFFGLNYGLDRLNKNKNEIDTFIRKNIFPIWTHCDACSDLFYNYIPKTYKTLNPLIISGFDSQVFQDYSSKYLSSKLDSIIKSLDLPITKRPEYSTEIMTTIDTFISALKYSANKSSNILPNSMRYLTEIKNEAGQKLETDDFWMVVIDNLICLNIEYRNMSKKNYYDAARDSMMAINLKWLVQNKFKNEKIIVWAASVHISKFKHDFKRNFITTMGDFFTKDSLLMKESYIVAFTSFEGETGRLYSNKYTIDKPKHNGFETWIDKSFNYSFVDFREYNKLNPKSSEKFYLKGMGHYNAKRQWNRIYDGIFFIRKMYACKKMKLTP